MGGGKPFKTNKLNPDAFSPEPAQNELERRASELERDATKLYQELSQLRAVVALMQGACPMCGGEVKGWCSRCGEKFEWPWRGC